MSLDFRNALLPQFLPLEASFAENEVEADLKRLFLTLFGDNLAPASFDANVLGAAHLGSLDLVRKAVNTDGLVLLRGDREESATRYLYRAWKSSDAQGRGLHFLRTYLQMLFPNNSDAYQLYQNVSSEYPTELRANGGNGWFLTSRVQILVDAQVVPGNQLDFIYKSIVSILPARFVPRIAVTKTFGSKLRVVSAITPFAQLDASGHLAAPAECGSLSIRAIGVLTGFSLMNTAGQIGP